LYFQINYGQEGPGIHKIESEKYKTVYIEKNTSNSHSEEIIPLKVDAEKNLSKAVFGYLPYWEYSTSKDYLRYDLLTHIALFSFDVSESGSISNPPGGLWPWTDVINEAHQNGVKVVMCVINFDISKNEMHNLLVTESLRQNFIACSYSSSDWCFIQFDIPDKFLPSK
jgi:spore germination protein YaaH